MSLKKIDKQYLLHTYNKDYTNFIKGKNATLFDDKGKNYIDFGSGIGVVSVGHGNKKVAKTIHKQVSKITHISNLQVIEPQVLLAQKLVQMSGFNMACFFGNSGAEANETAIKIARKYGYNKYDSKKYKILTLENSFHGRTITTAKATGQEKIHKKDFSPYPKGFHYETSIEKLYQSIDNTTLAVMIELIQGEGGVKPFDKKEIQKLAQFLKEKGILLIVDEVQTGIYRTGEFLASHLYDIEPDIITLAKGLGGGIPIGVVMTKLKNVLEFGDHGSTFGGNYLSTKTSLVVCDILEQYKQSGKIDKTIYCFNKHLERFYKNHLDIFKDIVGVGFMKGLRVKEENTLQTIIQKSFENGTIVLRAGQNTLRFLPPLTISEKEIKKGFERLELTMKQIKRKHK